MDNVVLCKFFCAQLVCIVEWKAEARNGTAFIMSFPSGVEPDVPHVPRARLALGSLSTLKEAWMLLIVIVICVSAYSPPPPPHPDNCINIVEQIVS